MDETTETKDEYKKEKFKFKLKVFLIYLLEWNFTEKTFPNLNTISLIALFVSLLIRNLTFTWISLGVWIICYGIKEWKSGEFVYWYKQRKYKKRNEALKKVREEKKKKFIGDEDEKDKWIEEGKEIYESEKKLFKKVREEEKKGL